MPSLSPSSAAPEQHVDVLIVGAGISGVDVAWRLQQRRPDTSYLILEAREEVGGTWDLFRYPGIRSDSDIATFAFPFRPFPGEQVLAGGAEIKAYVEATADEAGITERIRFGTSVRQARWSSDDQRWTVCARGPAGEFTLTCAFLHLATGYYDYEAGYLPDYPGLDDFEGTFVHPQQWPEDLDVSGRRVVVIGSGATAMTLIPALADTAKHVTMLQRSPTWVASMPNRDPMAQLFGRWLPPKLAHHATRSANIVISQTTYSLARRRPERFAALLRASLRRDLKDEDYLDAHFTPDYPPWDQRVCRIPDGDLTRAIAHGRASVVTDSLDCLVAEGLRLGSGEVLPADVIVSATGLSLLLVGGITIVVDGEVVDASSRVAYRGLMLERVPNLTFTIGYVNSSWTLRSDLVARYLCRLLALMDRRGFAVATPGSAPPGQRRPLLNLKAGYVLRALDRMPQLAPKRPWTYVQNFLIEAPELLYGRLGTDMLFTPQKSLTRRTMTPRAITQRAVATSKGPRMRRRRGERALGRYMFAGGTAVVTGAAGGIGEQLVRQLADHGSHLALVDQHRERLAALVGELRHHYPSLRISSHTADLAEPEQVARLVPEVLVEHRSITLLINNAGVALAGRFDQLSTEDIDWLLQINLHAPIALTRGFLPALVASSGSHVVNISSLFGLVGPPGQTAYATSKYGLRGFSESLRQELRDDGVGVTVVHPAGVATRIAKDSRTGADLEEAEAQAGREAFAAVLSMDPTDAARIILRGTARRRRRVLVGGAAVALDLLERVSPGSGGAVLAFAQLRIEQRAAERRETRDGAGDRASVSPPVASTSAEVGETSPLSGVRLVTAAGTQVRVRVTGPTASEALKTSGAASTLEGSKDAGRPEGGLTEVGDTSTIVLLHGIGRSLEDWNLQHDLLSEHHQVISLDLPGFGYSPRSPAGMGLESLADAANATLDALGHVGPVHVVGNSLGGAIAMTLSTRHPERVASLTLANSAGFGPEVTLNLRIIAVPLLGHRLLSRPSWSRTASIERTLYADSTLATRERVDHALALALVPGRARDFRECLLSIGGLRGVDTGWREALLSRVAAYPVPTLIVWGEQDAVLPATHLQAAARALPRAHTVLMTGTGHLPQIERPEEFALLVLEQVAARPMAPTPG
ncbi:MAG: SDR family NAD(P)-dependent oxidoreductase [Ornithinimicrobium sp.]